MTMALRLGLSWALFGLVAVRPAHAAKPAADREALRRLATLPQLSFSVKAGFSAEGRMGWEHEPPDPQEGAGLRERVREHPANPEAHLELARWLARADRSTARPVYSNAVVRYRALVEQRPHDGLVLAHWGEALWGMEERAEAEAVLRRAVRIAPEEPEGWFLLARFLDSASFRELLADSTRGNPPTDVQGLVALLVRLKPTGPQFEAAEQRYAEALECFHRAIALAPTRAECYEARAKFRLTGAMIQAVKTNAPLVAPDASVFAAATMSPECLPDLQRCVELQPHNARLWGAVAMFEAFCHFFQPPGPSSEPRTHVRSLWKTLPADTVQSIRRKLDRLAEIAESSSTQAAEAAEVLGILYLSMLQDSRQAAIHFRRAVELDPKREQAWHGWIATLAHEERHAEMVRACETLVKRQDSALHRLYLAKAYAASDQWERAVTQCRAALRRAPDSFLAQLAMAAALIRADADPQAWREAMGQVRRASESRAPKDAAQEIHLRFTAGLVLALGGEVAQARQAFEEVLRVNPDHPSARQALAVVSAW